MLARTANKFASNHVENPRKAPTQRKLRRHKNNFSIPTHQFGIQTAYYTIQQYYRIDKNIHTNLEKKKLYSRLFEQLNKLSILLGMTVKTGIIFSYTLLLRLKIIPHRLPRKIPHMNLTFTADIPSANTIRIAIYADDTSNLT